MSKKRTMVSWGDDPRGRLLGCDMAEVVAWYPNVHGKQVDVLFKSGTVLTLPLTPGQFGEGHADGMGYRVEKPPAQTEMPLAPAESKDGCL